MYAVCKPTYTKAGLPVTEINKYTGRPEKVQYWSISFEHEELPVRDMEEAKQLFGGAPVLQWIGGKASFDVLMSKAAENHAARAAEHFGSGVGITE